MVSKKLCIAAVVLLAASCVTVQAQSSSRVVSLLPKGKCDGPDGRPRKCGGGLPGCGDCPGFSCMGCPGCPGTVFQGSCLPSNFAISCALPQGCDEKPPVCKVGQSCQSNDDCKGCGSDVTCKSCPVCPGQERKGTCRRSNELFACPKIGCVTCKDRPCNSNQDCQNCGESGYQCVICKDCNGTPAKSGTCKRKGLGLCPVLDCKCDKRGSSCSSNADCCSRTEICFKCHCNSFSQKPGECVSRSFRAPAGGATRGSAALGGLPPCPPCLPPFGDPLPFPLFP